MKIAVTYEKGSIFQHFGHTEQFKVYEIDGGIIKTIAVIDTGGNGHGALAGFLRGNGVDTLICGGIGSGAKQALAEAEIQVYGGVTGDADEAAESLLAGKLIYNPEVQCTNHGEGHHHHGNGHSCGHAH